MSVKAIRALDRGLDVLRIIQESKAASLNDLHLATRLSKATLLRILKTLISRDLIWQRIADGAYVPSYTFSKRARVFDEETHLAEVAAPILAELCKRVRWPSALLSPRLDHMVTIESNRPSPILTTSFLPTRSFVQREHVAIGSGRCLLVFVRRRNGLEFLHVSENGHAGDVAGPNRPGLTGVAGAPAGGYGTRDRDFGGNYVFREAR